MIVMPKVGGSETPCLAVPGPGPDPHTTLHRLDLIYCCSRCVGGLGLFHPSSGFSSTVGGARHPWGGALLEKVR